MHSAIRRFLLAMLLLAALLLAAASPTRAQTAEAIRAEARNGHALHEPALVRAVYERRAYTAAWFQDGRPLPAAHALGEALSTAGRHGLDPAAYGATALAHRLGMARAGPHVPPEALAALDVLLTDAFLQYAAHRLHGRVRPASVHPGWTLPLRSADLAAVLEDALASGDVEAVLATLDPSHAEYDGLREALARYRRLAGHGGWPTLPDGPTLRHGDAGPRVALLRRRLHTTGDLHTAPPSNRFDDDLDAAVRVFQRRHGLDADGAVGPKTRHALNIPVEARVRQIARTMERWRWLPDSLGPRYVLVNLAGCSLVVVEGEAPVLSMRVIVGTRANRTPVFSARLTEVVLAPYWNVPKSIARGEILPRLAQDPGYLARNHIRRLPGGWLRQDPGPANPLGRVKFTIANPYGIGLHDTPARALFERAERLFSHGCIRLESPLALARYVLRAATAWTPRRIEETIARWAETRVPAPDPLPVHVLYWTAWTDTDGGVHFREDGYSYDERLARLLGD